MPLGPETKERVTPKTLDEWELFAQEGLMQLHEEDQPAERHLQIDYAVARFCHAYPGQFNGSMNWKLFWLLYHQIPRFVALDRWNMTQAHVIFEGMAHAKDEGSRKMQRHHTKDFEYGNNLID